MPASDEASRTLWTRRPLARSSALRSGALEGGLPITGLLLFGLGALVFLALAGVLAVTLGAAARNTIGLLEDKSRLLLTSTVERTRQFLDPAEAQAEFVARMIERGEVDPDNREQLAGALYAALAAAPQVLASAWLDADGWMSIASHDDDEPLQVRDWRTNETGREVMADAEHRRQGAFWGRPIYSSPAGTTIVNFRRPVFADGRLRGLVASSISVEALSGFLASLETETGQHAFILYEDDQVLAHRALEREEVVVGPGRPLPSLHDVGDPVLSGIWSEDFEDRGLVAGSGHIGTVDGEDYVYLYTTLDAYGEEAWTVGSYFLEEDIGEQIQRLIGAGIVGALALAAALTFALLIGRKVSRPIGELAEAAGAIGRLEIEKVPDLRPSRLRELDQAARAFNAMVGALRVFTHYVPRQVVQASIAGSDLATRRAERRQVTVMFTDIAGFTARVESLGAEETAAFLNRHFDLVTAGIEAEGGIVDKFIGDGVMALWGALDEQPDHALAAVRAARRIAAAIHADNKAQAPAVRLRIGIHTGEVMVGNIGARARTNFTVVGDTVNVAERLQTLGKSVAPAAEVVVLVSATTAERLGDRDALEPVGEQRIRGRAGMIEVFRLRDIP